MTMLKQMILMPVLNRLVIKPSVSYVIKRISLKRQYVIKLGPHHRFSMLIHKELDLTILPKEDALVISNRFRFPRANRPSRA